MASELCCEGSGAPGRTSTIEAISNNFTSVLALPTDAIQLRAPEAPQATRVFLALLDSHRTEIAPSS